MVSTCKVYGTCNWPPGSHLGPKFQNEATCINGPLLTMFMHDHVQVTLLSTEIWLRKGPSGQSPKSAIWRPYWIGPKFYLTCIKVLSWVITVPNMNEIHSFMSENGLRNGFHMSSIWKTKLATWRPSWTKIAKFW